MRNGKIDILDKCVSCGQKTDNDTGKIANTKDIEKNAYVNHWLCKKCIVNDIWNKLDDLYKEIKSLIEPRILAEGFSEDIKEIKKLLLSLKN